MKVKIGIIDTSNWVYNPDNKIIQGVMNNVNQHLQMHPFVYNGQPNHFRLVIEWEFIMKDVGNNFTIINLNGTQGFQLSLDGNNDKETLTNILSTSHMHFEDELKQRLKGTVLESYSFIWQDFSATADNILALVRKQ